jgi:CNT family concentrative nucleoside transporter
MAALFGAILTHESRWENAIQKLSGLLGIFTILAIAYLFSANRKAIKLKTVAWGLGLQFLSAVLVLRTTMGQNAFAWIGSQIARLLAFARFGSSFVFGQLGTPGNTIALFAFQVLPTIIFEFISLPVSPAGRGV